MGPCVIVLSISAGDFLQMPPQSPRSQSTHDVTTEFLYRKEQEFRITMEVESSVIQVYADLPVETGQNERDDDSVTMPAHTTGFTNNEVEEVVIILLISIYTLHL